MTDFSKQSENSQKTVRKTVRKQSENSQKNRQKTVSKQSENSQKNRQKTERKQEENSHFLAHTRSTTTSSETIKINRNFKNLIFSRFSVLSRFGPILPRKVQCAGYNREIDTSDEEDREFYDYGENENTYLENSFINNETMLTQNMSKIEVTPPPAMTQGPIKLFSK